jgi:hypothetical protein
VQTRSPLGGTSRSPLRTIGAATAVMLGGMLAVTAPALADGSMTLSVSADPVRGLPVQFVVSGTAPSNATAPAGADRLQLTDLARPAAWGPCAADELDDPVSRAGSGPTSSVFEGPSPLLAPGAPFSVSWSGHLNYQSKAGPYLLCAWLEALPAYDTVLTAQTPFTLRVPHFRLQVTAPRHAAVGKRGTFAVTGYAESAGWVDTELLPPYAYSCNAADTSCHKVFIHRCPSAAYADPVPNPSNTDVYEVAAGPVRAGRTFRVTRSLVARQPGAWLFCAYLHDGGEGSSSDGGYGPVAVAQSRRFTVARREG